MIERRANIKSKLHYVDKIIFPGENKSVILNACVDDRSCRMICDVYNLLEVDKNYYKHEDDHDDNVWYTW